MSCNKKPLYLTLLTLLTSSSLFGVTNASELETAIIQANNGSLNPITFDNNISYSQLFQPLNASDVLEATDQSFTINGANNTLERTGASPFRGFFVRSNTETVTIENLTIENAHAVGGTGGRRRYGRWWRALCR